MTSSNRHNASVKLAVGLSGLSKLAFVVNLRNNGVRLGSQHCNTQGRSNTMGQNGTFTVSVQLNEMPRVQQSISSSTTVIAGQPVGFVLLHHQLICLLKYVLPYLCSAAKPASNVQKRDQPCTKPSMTDADYVGHTKHLLR